MIVEVGDHLRDFVAILRGVKTPDRWHSMAWSDSLWYHALVEEMAFHIWPLNRVPYYYQAEPNLRIQPPGGECVPWHSDSDFGHLPPEWNVWIPLTEITDKSQMLWVDEGPMGPTPIDVHLGEAYIFPGAQWKHGNIANATEIERRSFDFRLIRQEDFVDKQIRTVEYNMMLSVGEYWRG